MTKVFFSPCPEPALSAPWACSPPKKMKDLSCVILSEEVAAATDESKDPFVAQFRRMFFHAKPKRASAGESDRYYASELHFRN